MPTGPSNGRWLLRRPPDDAEILILGFPYLGVGASSYRLWPQWVGAGWVGGLQPPGRENRTRETPHTSHGSFVSDLADFLSGYSDRRLVLVAHCGAVTWALETVHALVARGLPGPSHLLASSWGRPDRGPYGPLGSIDLETADLVEQVTRQGAQEGTEVRPDVAAVAARVLRHDLQTQQAYRYDATRPLPCPVTVVAWTRDDVVPPQQVIGGWETCTTASYRVLDGDHLAFLRCPPELQDVLTQCVAQSA